MRSLCLLAVLFGTAACDLLAQPGINSASVNGIVSPPASTQIYPNQGASISAVFQNQGAGLAYAFFTFETWPSPSYSCKVGVQVGSPVSTSNVYLHDDNSNPFGGMGLGSGQRQDNSKCALFSSGSDVTQNGNQFTVTVNVIFKDPFNGVKYIWVDGYDGNLVSSGWYSPNAAFTVQSQDYAPETVYVSPSSGSNQAGQTQQFAYTTSDPNGAFTMYHTELVFNQGSNWIPGYNPSRRCKIIQDSNFVSLENDGQNGYVNGGYAPFGSSQPISNSQCTVYPSMSGGTTNSLQAQTITFAVSFTPSFSGQMQDHIFAADNLGLSTWDTQANGTWTWNTGTMQRDTSSSLKPIKMNNYLTGDCGGTEPLIVYNDNVPVPITIVRCSGTVDMTKIDTCAVYGTDVSCQITGSSTASMDVQLTANPNTTIGPATLTISSRYYFEYWDFTPFFYVHDQPPPSTLLTNGDLNDAVVSSHDNGDGTYGLVLTAPGYSVGVEYGFLSAADVLDFPPCTGGIDPRLCLVINGTETLVKLGAVAAYGVTSLWRQWHERSVQCPYGWPGDDGTVPPRPGWTWSPPTTAPGSNEGAWVPPSGSGESLHPDLTSGKGKHWDYIDKFGPNRTADGKGWRVWPDGKMTPKK